ncbi:MAG: glutamine--tRNA ligase/YqeY domain fusion protein [Myxococcales bacterium]|jgi:glutaminyl-tRNA synthetase|nr:glutamine--tRNA ligase/YqeY domain fusion protein [Myxococcales bacterium]
MTDASVKAASASGERPRDDSAAPNFIADIVDEDLRTGKNGGRLQTRFPPEPNGYLHVGHAKAICLNFGIAEKAPGGLCNLRMDDTNPLAEEAHFVEAIQEDVRWLGFDWGDRLFFASDYFERLYECAVTLVKKGLAYVDSQTPEQIRENRGNYYKAGVDSPFRDRSVEENLALLEKMRRGELKEGEAVLRAKIDMAHKNLNFRDPLIYRIRHAAHHRTGDAWCIYPMYDFAHPLSDAFEGVTHSLCTLEFENHRPLYEWFLEHVGGFDPVPRQIEFARLNLTYTVLSKRKLQLLVNEKHVAGWDDPRMPTIAGMRRRGYLPESIRAFCERIGVAKRDNQVDVALLEHKLREDLNAHCPRMMAVLRPLKVVIENYPEGEVEYFEAQNHPEYPERGTRKIPFSRELYIEQDDFMENPPKKFFRLSPGQEVRLRSACLITCREVVKNDAGEVVELRCTWDPDSRGGSPKDGRKVKGTLHWVSAAHAVRAEVRLYDRLFNAEDPEGDEDKHFLEHLNPSSLEVLSECYVEPTLAEASVGERFQFERLGYFVVDPDSAPGRPVFNRTIGLRDSWAKVAAKA